MTEDIKVKDSPWKESCDKFRQRIKKQRHHFAHKGVCSQSYGFFNSHVRMWELDHKDGWTQRIDAFALWYWRRFLRVPWTVRRSNQSILKEINPEYSLEGLMLMLKLQYFEYLMERANSLEKTLMLGKIDSRRRRGRQRRRWLDSVTDIPSAKTSPGAGQVCLIVVMVIWLNAFVKIQNYVPKVSILQGLNYLSIKILKEFKKI